MDFNHTFYVIKEYRVYVKTSLKYKVEYLLSKLNQFY